MQRLADEATGGAVYDGTTSIKFASYTTVMLWPLPTPAHERLQFILSGKLNSNKNVLLNPEKVQLLEKSTRLSLIEKLEIVLVFLGEKISTEVGSQQGLSTQSEYNARESALKSLGLYFSFNQIHRNGKIYSWFQVSTSPGITELIERFGPTFTDLEQGIIYGFPVTSIQAFAGLRPQQDVRPKTPGVEFFAGVMSAEFWQEEQRTFDRWFARIGEVSPKLHAQALQEYNQRSQA